MRGVVWFAVLLAFCAGAWAARARFVFEERPGRVQAMGEVRWREALLRASVGGCKARLPRGARLRPRIHDCVVTQVHVTNLSPLAIECRVELRLPAPDDDGRRHIEQHVRIEALQERWVATAYGPSTLEPETYESRCVAAAT